MRTSFNENQLNMFGDEELLFDDELLLDEVTPPPNSSLLTTRNADQPKGTNTTYPILLFARQESQQTILWPVYGWRIAAPQIKNRRLNFLQITSLRLARAGVTRHQEQAAHLGLDKNLLWKVMNQLSEDEGYMDMHGRLTEKGQKILQKDGEEEEERTVYGWIFQEATAGELLPWFHTNNLRFADSSRSDIAQNYQLPWIWKQLQPPDASDVTAAILKQRRLIKKFQDFEPTKEQNTEPEDSCEFTEIDNFIAPASQPVEHEEVQLSKDFGIRFLSQQPQQFYLLVRAIIEGSYDGQFFLRCPFGLNDGLRWVRLLNFAAFQCAEGSQLVNQLRQCSCDAWKRRQPPDIEPLAVGRQVYDKVVRDLGPSPDKSWQEVWQELERMEQSLLLLERGFDEGIQPSRDRNGF